MKKIITILFFLLVLTLLVVGCTRNQGSTGYAAYGQPQQQQQPYYGGGCGIAPADNAVEVVESAAETSSSSL